MYALAVSADDPFRELMRRERVRALERAWEHALAAQRKRTSTRSGLNALPLPVTRGPTTASERNLRRKS